jgi:NAD+ kinase
VSALEHVGFILHPGQRDVIADAVAAATALGYATWAETDHPAEAIAARCADTALLVTVGGDGTFLFGARLAAPHGIPVLGVNRGRLGFLTDVELGTLPEALGQFATGRCTEERRSMLTVTVTGPGEGLPTHTAFALNDVAVKSCGISVARIRVEADGELLGSFDCDGLVVATPTGSTAYAMSAGGPPVDPRIRALVVVPLAPHAVLTRAVLVPEEVALVITVERGTAIAAADGHDEIPLQNGSRIRLEPGSEWRIVKLPGSPSFLRRLREKVRFGTPLKTLNRGHGPDPDADDGLEDPR